MFKCTRCLALVPLLAAVTFLLSGSSVLRGQEAAPGGYRPPPTLERSLTEDPIFSQEMMKAYAGDQGGWLAFVEKQAADGKLLGEFLLGTMYIPPECTFLPFKNAPADCPSETRIKMPSRSEE